MHENMELNLVLLRNGKYWMMPFNQADLANYEVVSKLLTALASVEQLDLRHDLKKYALLTADVDQFVGNAIKVNTLNDVFA